MNKKFILQDEEYIRPYHHLLFLDENNNLKSYDYLSWGLEYFSYVSLILDILRNFKYDKLAEVGCGDGKIIYEIAKENKSNNRLFEGFDLSEQAILFANAYGHNLLNLNYYNKDFSKSIKKFDIITCIEVLEHIPDDQVNNFIKTIGKKLNSKGKFIISVPTKVIPVSKKHYRHYDLKLLKSQTSSDFNLESYYYVHKGYSFGSILLSKLLTNEQFIISNKFFRKLVLSLYKNFYLKGNEKNGFHLVAILNKKITK